MTIEQRVDKHERLINALISRLNNDKFYDDADKAGLRQQVSTKTDASEVSDAWNEKDLYKADRYVMSDNALWRCLIQNTNSRPYEDSPYWEKVNIAAEFNRLTSLINDLKKEDK